MIELNRCVITRELVYDLKCLMGIDGDEELAKIIYTELSKDMNWAKGKFESITIVAYGEENMNDNKEVRLQALKISTDLNGASGTTSNVGKIISDAKVIAEYLDGTTTKRTQTEETKGDKQLLQE